MTFKSIEESNKEAIENDPELAVEYYKARAEMAEELLSDQTEVIEKLKRLLSSCIAELEDETCGDCGYQWKECLCENGSWFRNSREITKEEP